MFDPFIFALFLLHAALLTGLNLRFLRRRGVSLADALPATALVLWVVIVMAGHSASLFSSLGSLPVWSGFSFLWGAALLGVNQILLHRPKAAALLTPPKISFWNPADSLQKRLAIFLIVSFAFYALCEIVLGFSVYPDNADSMIYRLPRAFWYVSHDSFTHPFVATDKRLTFYPLDGVALYVPLVLYNLPGTLHALPSLCAYFMIVFVVFRFARELGASKTTSFLAAWLVGLTPSILAQATSTNDEILAAVAMLLALLMGWRFLITGKPFFAFWAIVAVGLSAGTKMHIVYLLPLFAAFLFLIVGHLSRAPKDFKKWARAIDPKAGVGGLFLSAVMVFPFFLYNYVSTGRFYFFDEFAPQVFNLNASLHGFIQNLVIYLAQMVFAPVADLNFWPDANARQVFNAALNAIVDPLVSPFIDPDPSFYHMSYRYVGVTLPVSVRFVEFSLWSGFIWLLWPLQAIGAARQKAFPLRRAFLFLAMVPPAWLLIWSMTTLYMEGTATYFTYYLIVACPAAIFALAKPTLGKMSEGRWFVIVVVGLTNMLISFNLLMYSGFRALPDLYFARRWPYDWDLMDQHVIDEIRHADQIRIAETHEKMPYFAYMHWHPTARYLTPYEAIDPSAYNWEKTLQIAPISSLRMYGFMPIKLSEKKIPGLTYLGTIRAIGREIVFARGMDLAQRNPSESTYIVARAIVTKNPKDDTWQIAVNDAPMGVAPEDNLEYKYELLMNGERVAGSDWSADPRFSLPMQHNPYEMNLTLRTQVRSGLSHKQLGDVSYLLSQVGAWLPDEAEY